MNKRVYDECPHYMTFATRPHVWSVADIGEPGGISNVETKRHLFSGETYQEIVKNVDRLISEYSRQQAYLTLAAYEPSALSHRQCRTSISPATDLASGLQPRPSPAPELT
jgi:hypothetical protein